jgi:hypothetical protein
MRSNLLQADFFVVLTPQYGSLEHGDLIDYFIDNIHQSNHV